MEFNLNFSGNENSWFDYWHTHFDWEGEGNDSFEVRKKYLDELLSAFDSFKTKLNKYPLDFQCWIIIDENDSSEDAIYIHTKNPNSDNFPLQINAVEKFSCQNKNLADFIEKTKLEVVQVSSEDGKYFYLFDRNFGKVIIK